MTADRGYRSYRAGLSAEDGVAAHYAALGLSVAAKRWRCPAGEIDLVLRDGDAIVFVEVKRARDFAIAAARLGARQLGRLAAAAECYLGAEPRGTDTPARFDVALVDGTGRIEIVENILPG